MASELIDIVEAKMAELPDSLDAINDHFYRQGWTDGLPIIPPTAERVRAMLGGMPWRDGDEVIAIIPPAMGTATLHKIAVNAVMAGCLPGYLPTVVAAVQAVTEPKYGLAHRQTEERDEDQFQVAPLAECFGERRFGCAALGFHADESGRLAQLQTDPDGDEQQYD